MPAVTVAGAAPVTPPYGASDTYAPAPAGSRGTLLKGAPITSLARRGRANKPRAGAGLPRPHSRTSGRAGGMGEGRSGYPRLHPEAGDYPGERDARPLSLDFPPSLNR